MYYIGFTYQDAYNLPIWKRQWFLERTMKEFKDSNEKSPHNRAAHSNSPDQRALMGLRPDAPARLRRFT